MTSALHCVSVSSEFCIDRLIIGDLKIYRATDTGRVISCVHRLEICPTIVLGD